MKVFVFWSESAIEFAGSEISILKERVIDETSSIMLAAKDYFIHTIRVGEAERFYLLRGVKDDGKWEIIVQLGRYRPLHEIRCVDPEAKLTKKQLRYPDPIDDFDNKQFSVRDEITVTVC